MVQEQDRFLVATRALTCRVVDWAPIIWVVNFKAITLVATEAAVLPIVPGHNFAKDGESIKVLFAARGLGSFHELCPCPEVWVPLLAPQAGDPIQRVQTWQVHVVGWCEVFCQALAQQPRMLTIHGRHLLVDLRTERMHVCNCLLLPLEISKPLAVGCIVLHVL